jgi:hypothetical protein
MYMYYTCACRLVSCKLCKMKPYNFGSVKGKQFNYNEDSR